VARFSATALVVADRLGVDRGGRLFFATAAETSLQFAIALEIPLLGILLHGGEYIFDSGGVSQVFFARVVTATPSFAKLNFPSLSAPIQSPLRARAARRSSLIG
jgi:hypothetical protein